MRTPSIFVFTIFIVLIFVLFIRSSKIIPSFFTIKKGFFLPLRLSCKESSTFSPSPSSSGSRDVTALLGARDRYALRLADHQRSTPDCAGWDRLGKNLSICDFIYRIIHYLKIRNNQSCFMIQFVSKLYAVVVIYCSTGKTAGSIVTESAGSTTCGCKSCSASKLTALALGLR